MSSIPTPIDQKTSLWRSNPERMAWGILLVAFVTFVFMAVSIPMATRYVIRYATVPQEIVLSSTVGTVLLYAPRSEEPIAITESRKDVNIREGSRIETRGSMAQGELQLTFSEAGEPAVGTVVLYQGTDLEVLRIRRPRFRSSGEPYHVHLQIQEGHVRLLTNTEERRPIVAEVEVPHGRVVLSEGSYSVKVLGDETSVSVRRGRAILYHNGGDGTVVSEGLQTWMTADQPPAVPEVAQWDLVKNGDFSEGLQHWEPYAEGFYVTPGKVTVDIQDGRSVAHFIRQGPDFEHTEVGIRQQLDQDVNDYESLKLQIDVKLLNQTLPGAGQASSEYPVRVEIDFTSTYGQNLRWGYGFYYRDPSRWPVTDEESEQYQPGVWRSYESSNLIKYLAEKGTPLARINSIRIYASGWNYESMVSEIGLIAE